MACSAGYTRESKSAAHCENIAALQRLRGCRSRGYLCAQGMAGLVVNFCQLSDKAGFIDYAYI
jgi:hypothetical protein